MTNVIYMDWAATAPLCEEAAQAMAPYMQAKDNILYGANANSLHSPGRDAFLQMENARAHLASSIGARPDEVIFTAGATESDNTAVFGLIRGVCSKREQAGNPVSEPHIITGGIEHDGIMGPTHWLRSHHCRITRLPVNAQGHVSAHDLEQALSDDTVLVSVMLANNEVGTIEPIKELCAIAHEAGVLFHTDATQAFGKMPIDCHDVGVDAASFSSHKIGGPKGMGALYLAKKTPFEMYMYGGGQEQDRRSGTQNVAGMVGFAEAARVHCADTPQLHEEIARQRALRDKLYAGLKQFDCVVPSVHCPAGSDEFLPNIVDVCVKGFESETLILRLDKQGIAVAGGSACSSHSLEPSRVLTSLGIERSLALGALRFSLGKDTTEEEIDTVLTTFAKVLEG